ncbi:MAG: tetratricopeptide repeat protein [Spirochaetia bacterium]|nr:tetratricopeptide repeat protein [Spirochaetia bacterium]
MKPQYLAYIALTAFVYCRTAPPTVISNAHEESVANPELYRQSQEWINKANRQFQDKQYEESLASARKALGIQASFDGFFLEGNNLMKLGDQEKALPSYLQAEKIRPKEEQLALMLAMLYTSRGELDQAQIRYVKLMNDHPDEPLYAFKAGTGYKLMKDYPNAYSTLKKADVPTFKYRDQLYLQLGDVCVETKRYEEADAYFKKAHEVNPNLKDATSGQAAGKTSRLLEEGSGLFKQKRYQDALAKFEEAKRETPGSTAPLYLAASSLFALNRYAEAEANLNQLLKLSPDNTDGLLLLSAVYQKQGRGVEAEKLVRAEIKKAPGNAELFNRLGLIQKDEGQARPAIESFHRALALSPKLLSARINLAFAYLDDSRFADADREFQTAAAQEPNNEDLARGRQLVSVYRNLEAGDRLFRTRKFDKAIVEYNKAFAVKNDLPVITNSIARAEFEKRDFKNAETQYKKSLVIDTENTTAMIGLVKVYRAVGRTKEADAMSAKVNALVKANPARAVELGRLKEEENPAEAEAFYVKLLKDRPDDTQAKRRLAGLYYKQGLEANKKENYEQARTLFKKSKALAEVQGADEALAIVEDNIKHGPLLPGLRRAEELYSRGHFADALPIYEQTYARWDKSLILVKIASCKMELGRKEEALRTLNEAAEKRPEDLELTEAVFTYYLNLGETARAQKGFEQILDQHEDAFYSLYKLGIIELNKKKFPPAIEYFNRSMIYRPDFTESRIARGVARYQAGERDLARRDFEDAMNQKSELATLNLGMMHFNDNMMDQAEKIFRDLSEKYPGYAEPHYHLSFIYYNKNDLDKAEKEILEARKDREDPEDIAAHARILEKKYEQNRSPELAAKIRDLHKAILMKYPNSPRAKESREHLAKLEGNSVPVIVPYAGAAGKILNPAFYQNLVLVAENKSLQAFDTGTRKVIWRRFFTKPVTSLASGSVPLAVTQDEIHVLDPDNGADLNVIPCDAGARLLAGQERLLIVNPKNTIALQSLSERIAFANGDAKARYFVSGGTVYRTVRAGANISIDILSDKLAPAQSASLKGADALDIVSFGGLTLVMLPGELVILDGQLKKQKSIPMPAGMTQIAVAENGFLTYSANRIFVFNTDGNRKAERSGTAIVSARLLGDGRLVLADGREIRIIDAAGKQTWASPLPAGADKVYSLYY